jgi:hypothetical protein
MQPCMDLSPRLGEGDGDPVSPIVCIMSFTQNACTNVLYNAHRGMFMQKLFGSKLSKCRLYAYLHFFEIFCLHAPQFTSNVGHL